MILKVEPGKCLLCGAPVDSDPPCQVCFTCRLREAGDQRIEQAANVRSVLDALGSLSRLCERCGGDGKAHGADRPFEWSDDVDYGKCVVCHGTGRG